MVYDLIRVLTMRMHGSKRYTRAVFGSVPVSAAAAVLLLLHCC